MDEPKFNFTNHYYSADPFINYDIWHQRAIASKSYELYSNLLAQEVDFNDILIKDQFYYGFNGRNGQKYFKFAKLNLVIDTNNKEEYFRFIVEDFEFKSKILETIGISLGQIYFPKELFDLPITNDYFSKKVNSKNKSRARD